MLSPGVDAFASATAFTGMWLMTKKKVESWYWWIATNIASDPFILCEALCVYQRLLCNPAGDGGLWIN